MDPLLDPNGKCALKLDVKLEHGDTPKTIFKSIVQNCPNAKAIVTEKEYLFVMVGKECGREDIGEHLTNVELPFPIHQNFFEIMLYTKDEPHPLLDRALGVVYQYNSYNLYTVQRASSTEQKQ